MHNPLNDLQPVEAIGTHSPYGDVTGTKFRTPDGSEVHLYAGPGHNVLARYRDTAGASNLELWVEMSGHPAYVRGSDAHLTESYVAYLLTNGGREVSRVFRRRLDADAA